MENHVSTANDQGEVHSSTPARTARVAKSYRYARRLFKAHKPMAEIITALGNRFTERQIRDGIRELESFCGVKKRGDYQKTIEIPTEVTDQRKQRVMLRHTNITALLMNDPLPGESALERREIKSPSITHDYLDDFIFAE